MLLVPILVFGSAIAVVSWAALERSSHRSENSDVARVFPSAVTASNVMSHLVAFESIATNGTNPAVASRSILNQYPASAEYVERLLNDSGYFNVSRMYFPALVWIHDQPMTFETQLSDGEDTWIAHPTTTPLDPVNGGVANALRYSGATPDFETVEMQVLRVDAGGCDAEVFTGVEGKAVLVTSAFPSGCDYYSTALAVQAAGAAALIVARSSPGVWVFAPRVCISFPNGCVFHLVRGII